MATIETEVLIEKAAHLIEALPYIRRFYGKTIVIKCGGAAMTNPNDMHSMMRDIALLYFCGIRPVIVHGGGPEISELCDRLQIPVQFAQGQRITDATTLEIVQMALLGKTNRTLVNALNQFGVKAVGISGQDAAFLQATPIQNELGFVGQVSKVDTQLINSLLQSQFVPIIAPIGVDAQAQAYNINADIAASAIAGYLAAEKLILLSDVNGVYADPQNPLTQIPILKMADIKNLLQAQKISGGMIPKLQACIDAIEQGVNGAHLVSGKLRHGLLLEILTDKGVGTMITQ